MTKKALIGAALATLMLPGCLTPPGQLTDDDFTIRSTELTIPGAQTWANFQRGFRRCGPETGIIFARLHGVPECFPEADGVVCDIYVNQLAGGRSNMVLGRADFYPSETGTLATFRVRWWPAKKDQIIADWQSFASGNAAKVCG